MQQKLIALAAAVVLAGTASIAFPQQQKKPPLSPPAQASVTIGGKKITIDYSAPSVRGRKIFGELVPYGKVWRAGANKATTLKTDADLQIRNLAVPKGEYTLYIWPEANGWQLVVNKQTGQWGTVYKPEMDLGRVPMDMGKTASPVETFAITLAETGSNQGQLKMEWEGTTASVPFSVK